jgi:tRNA threonylcarbamoyladenosine biosynthesis protein TsaB
MIFLVTDTSGKQGSVALVRAQDHEIAVIDIAPLTGGTFSAQLVPQIASLLAAHNFSKADIDGFIVVSGPGSFTGLRVGLAAIKALAEILRKPIIPVSLLEVLALATSAQGTVVAALDAGRGEAYAAEYEIRGDSAQVVKERVLPKAEFAFEAGGLPVATSDPALAEIGRGAGLSVFLVEPVSIGAIASLGYRKLRAGVSISPEQLDANYMRRSDAEIFAKVDS